MELDIPFSDEAETLVVESEECGGVGCLGFLVFDDFSALCAVNLLFFAVFGGLSGVRG